MLKGELMARSDDDYKKRFWTRVQKTDGCWIWKASTESNGYGCILIRRKAQVAHRLAYEWTKGPIPEGKELDHLCRNRRCVNPDHLEPVTCRENILRGNAPSAKQARQTHCKRGHPLFGSNLYLEPNGRRRRCRQCMKMYLNLI